MKEWNVKVKRKSIQKGGVIMKTWYCVTSSFDNRGRVTANITATKGSGNVPGKHLYKYKQKRHLQ